MFRREDIDELAENAADPRLNKKVRCIASGVLEYGTEWMIACEQGFLTVWNPNFRLKKFSIVFRSNVKSNRTREQSPIRRDRSKQT